MKATTKLVHKTVKSLRLEDFFAWAGGYVDFFYKFIPLPADYQSNELRIIIRSGVRFCIDMSDYMQWTIFISRLDSPWKFSKSSKQPNVILDIGANVGQFCLRAAALMHGRLQIHAFEPNPHALKFLERNLSYNRNLKDKIFVHSIALGNVNGMKPFSFSETNSGGGSVDTGSSGIIVQIRKLDEWVKEQNVNHIDFVKIDVEGFEPMVLLGAAETIKLYKPDMYIEITDDWFKRWGYSSTWVDEYLKSFGYTTWVDFNGKLQSIEDISKINMKQFNIFASVKAVEV
jgi:FkbM family methyltransferase